MNVLEAARDNHIVLFFYPGDREGLRYGELSGCSVEGRDFRDNVAVLEDLAVAVYGVSLHTTERQREFVERERLDFELLSDHEKRLTAALGVPLWISDDGEEFTSRNTILAAKGGTVAAVFANVESAGHVDQVIAAARSLA